jgi:hypothetical protein
LNEQSFDEVFVIVDRDADGKLSCREMELLYYLYTLQLSESLALASEAQPQPISSGPTRSDEL